MLRAVQNTSSDDPTENVTVIGQNALPEQMPEKEPKERVLDVRVIDLVHDPDAYDGKLVRVAARVEEAGGNVQFLTDWKYQWTFCEAFPDVTVVIHLDGDSDELTEDYMYFTGRFSNDQFMGYLRIEGASAEADEGAEQDIKACAYVWENLRKEAAATVPLTNYHNLKLDLNELEGQLVRTSIKCDEIERFGVYPRYFTDVYDELQGPRIGRVYLSAEDAARLESIENDRYVRICGILGRQNETGSFKLKALILRK